MTDTKHDIWIIDRQSKGAHRARKIIFSDDEISVWSDSWYGRHVIGQDCDFEEPKVSESTMIAALANVRVTIGALLIDAEKKILDATCGCRAMWFNKENPATLFCDIRKGEFKLHDGRVLEVNPDVEVDFRRMPFPDNSFYLVVWDPPHRSDLTKGNWMDIQYGTLLPTWEDDIKQGFGECMRVLKPNGVLIFKWNEKQIKLNRILSVINCRPLFGHTRGKTIWMTFMKPANLQVLD